jgi:glutaredoxin
MKYRHLALVMAAATAVTLGSVGVQAQTVYRIVGPDGKVTFSDKPPVAAAANVTARNAGGRPADAGAQTSALPYELRQVVARFPVTLYAGAGCVPCNAGRLMLQARGIPYTEYAIASNEDVEALQRLSGDKSLPFLTIGGQKIKGYAEAEWTQFLNAANYPATSQLPANFRYPAPKPLVSTQKLSPAPDAAEAREAGEAPSAAAAAPAAPAEAPSATNPAGIKF